MSKWWKYERDPDDLGWLVFMVVLILLALTGCRHNPLALDGAMRVREQWQYAEECIAPATPHHEFGDIQWFVVMTGPDEYIPSGSCPMTGCGGLWRGWEKAIYLDDDYENHELVVRHEILHAQIGDGDHCSPLWDSCGARLGNECDSVIGVAQ
jgi:hypothetical protein